MKIANAARLAVSPANVEIAGRFAQYTAEPGCCAFNCKAMVGSVAGGGT